MSVSMMASDRLLAGPAPARHGGVRPPGGEASKPAARRGDKFPGGKVIIEMQPRSLRQRAGGAGCSGYVCLSRRDEGSLLGRRRPAGIGDAPDRAAAVLGNEQGAIPVDGHTDRPAPHRTVVDDKAGGEILVFAGRHTIFHNHANNFVAGALGEIPRTMLGGKDVAAIVRRKLRSVIDRYAERSRMRFDQNVGQRHLVFEVGALAAVMRIYGQPKKEASRTRVT